MESLFAAQDNDNLLPMVDYRLSGNRASYLTQRDEVMFLSSVTEVSDTGERVATFTFNSDQINDLDFLHCSFEVHNDASTHSTHALGPDGHHNRRSYR